jgi:hypothetical protein
MLSNETLQAWFSKVFEEPTSLVLWVLCFAPLLKLAMGLLVCSLLLGLRATLVKGPRSRVNKLSILIGQEVEIGSKAFRQGSKMKTNQIVILLT